jgi:hypothetical protein
MREVADAWIVLVDPRRAGTSLDVEVGDDDVQGRGRTLVAADVDLPWSLDEATAGNEHTVPATTVHVAVQVEDSRLHQDDRRARMRVPAGGPARREGDVSGGLIVDRGVGCSRLP